MISQKIYEEAVIFNEERTRDMILMNAEEHYLKLITHQSDIIKMFLYNIFHLILA